MPCLRVDGVRIAGICNLPRAPMPTMAFWESSLLPIAAILSRPTRFGFAVGPRGINNLMASLRPFHSGPLL